MFKKNIFFIIFIIFLLTGCQSNRVEKFLPQKLKINNKVLNLELAISKPKQEKGLSGRKKLADDYGMLFLYNRYFRPGFWMKDMLISIDIVWIKDNTIVGIEKSLPIPKNNENLPVFYPKSDINRVLEVKSGLVDKYDWRIGDKVDFY